MRVPHMDCLWPCATNSRFFNTCTLAVQRWKLMLQGPYLESTSTSLGCRGVRVGLTYDPLIPVLACFTYPFSVMIT